MESLHAFLARIGTRNRTGAPASGTASCCASVVAQTAVSAVSRVANPLAVRRSNASPISNRRYGRLATCATEQRFMESLHDFDAAHWDHEPLTAWSPGFSRPKPFEPPKGGTPNQPRFMASLHAFFVAHWDQEPEIRKLFGIKPSVFRFMESLHANSDARWDHEPRA